MTDLRTLAQAVVDAPDDDAARVALGRWLGFPRGADPTLSVAVDILAALDAERAQAFNDGVASGLTRGYARAMGEVVEQLDSLSDADGSVEAWQAVRKLAERGDR